MRLITRSAQQPLKLAPQDTAVWLCRCGLSSDGIFCDGSHTSTLGEDTDRLHIYQGPTLERTTARVDVEDEKSIRIIESGSGWHIACFAYDDRQFDQVIALRKARGDNNLMDRYDLHARHYGLYKAGVMAATLRVHYNREGPMDCKDYYPTILTKEPLSQHVGSASRLLKSKDQHIKHLEIKQLITAVWRHGLRNGIYCDVINSAKRMIPYYQRLGYRRLTNNEFIHPRLGTKSTVMIFSPFLFDDHILTDYIKGELPNANNICIEIIRSLVMK